MDGFRVDAVDAIYETNDLTQNEPRSYRDNVYSVSLYDFTGTLMDMIFNGLKQFTDQTDDFQNWEAL